VYEQEFEEGTEMSNSTDLKIVGGQTVTNATVRVPLLIGSPDNIRVKSVLIAVLPTNTGYVYIGDATVAAATTSLILGIVGTTALQSVTISLTDEEWKRGESINLSKIYIDVSVNGEGVSYLLMRN
jgi:hypothetical protein